MNRLEAESFENFQLILTLHSWHNVQNRLCFVNNALNKIVTLDDIETILIDKVNRDKKINRFNYSDLMII